MNRNAAPFLRVVGCFATLALFNFLLPSQAGQAVPPGAKLLDALVARNIGPANMSGRIVAITGLDNDPNTVYAATASGGLLKTTDGGETWKILFDRETSISIGDVAVSQSNPNIVWVGTGEHNARNSVAWGDGVYKSTDGGLTWTHMGLRDSHSIGRVIIHPTNPDIVYVAVLGHIWGPNKERGIFKTIDGGKTWQVSKFIDENTGFIEMKMDPTEPDILYAGAYCCRRDAFSGGNPKTFIGPGAGLYKTSDAGKTWDKMGGGLPTNGYGRCGLDIYHTDPNVVYAIVQTDKTITGDANQGNPADAGTPPANGGIFRSDDKGKTWKHMNSLVTRPFYFGQIRVDPSDDKHIFVLGVNTVQSFDGGSKFGGGKGGGGGGKGGGPHSDHHALWISPKDSKIAWLGTDGGVNLSKDNGKSFRPIRMAALGQFYGVSADMSKPYYVYGGLQDNGGWGGPSATYDSVGIRQNLWFSISGGDGFHTQNDPTDPNIVYTESQNGGLARANVANKGKGGKGGGGGGKGGGVSAKGSGGRFNWSTPMLLSPHDPKVFYYGAQFLLKSTERGVNLKRISPNLTYGPDTGKSSGHTLFTIGESPLKKDAIWTGSDDGCIFVSTDGGDSWVDVSEIPGMPKDSCISRVEPSHFDEGGCYVSITRYRNDDRRPYIFKTTDYGATWQNIASDLPESGSVHVVIDSSKNKDLLFCGTEFGLFVSFTGGKNWLPMKAGLPTVAVHDLVIHPRERDLIIGTHGRSIYVIDDISPLEQQTPEILSRPAHLFGVRPAVAFTVRKGEPLKSNEFAGQNPPYGALIRYHLKTPWPQDVTIAVTDMTGKKLATLKAENTAGLHQVVWNLKPDGENKATVPPGEYWALLSAGSQKQYRRIHVEAEPKPEKKAEEKVEKKADDKGDKKADEKDLKKADDKKGDDKDVKKGDDKKKDDKGKGRSNLSKAGAVVDLRLASHDSIQVFQIPCLVPRMPASARNAWERLEMPAC
jgi:photosystem II stability/assembly factor-like uncharacterized protein